MSGEFYPQSHVKKSRYLGGVTIINRLSRKQVCKINVLFYLDNQSIAQEDLD